MRAVVLGARGMLGHMVVTVLEEAGHEVVGVCRSGGVGRHCEHLDLEDRNLLHRLLSEMRPGWVVNAAGKLNRAVDDAPAPSIYVNSYLPHLLAQWGPSLGFRLLHVSTDCVFEGTRGAYRAEDRPDATSAYGRSKALGEVHNPRDLTIRTSIIGPEIGQNGTGLMRWFVQQKERASGWTKAIWTGLTTLELARVIEATVDSRLAETGLWQCVPDRAISKHALLLIMNRTVRPTPIIVDAVDGEVFDKSLLNDRPEAWPVPGYEAMLAALGNWIEAHAGLYVGTPFAR